MDRWEGRKRRFLARIERDLSTGYFDVEMLDLVREINSNPNMYTTSSCSGRIVLIAGSQPWRKRGSDVLGKWHDGVSYEEICKLVDSFEGGRGLWLVLQSPILHVVCRDVCSAVSLIRLARSCGFRYSTILSKGDYGFLVELMGSERFDVPIVLGGRRIVDVEGLKVLLGYLNSKLKDSKGKIERLRGSLALLNEGAASSGKN